MGHLPFEWCGWTAVGLQDRIARAAVVAPGLDAHVEIGNPLLGEDSLHGIGLAEGGVVAVEFLVHYPVHIVQDGGFVFIAHLEDGLGRNNSLTASFCLR